MQYDQWWQILLRAVQLVGSRLQQLQLVLAADIQALTDLCFHAGDHMTSLQNTVPDEPLEAGNGSSSHFAHEEVHCPL